MEEILLTNGLKTCIKQNKNTPRIALSLNFAISKEEKTSGEYCLMNRLLMQGTQKYTSEELSSLLEENAIELSTDMKYDYLRFHFVALNEDFEFALSILADIINNSTFKEFEKERNKFKGELVADLDSAKVKISDLFTKTIYKNHFYGHTCSNILEEIDNVTLDDVKNSYAKILNDSYKTMAVVGDVDIEQTQKLLDKYLGNLPNSVSKNSELPVPQILKQEYVEIIKEDAQQAQIIQGWHVGTIESHDYAKLMLLNTILGASGLSSRLFLELREKKGLAYTVRTSYENHLKSSVFSIYIGTEPSNIQTSIEGFKIEIEKIKNELISEEELRSAKNNIIGKQQFVTETNSQQANSMAHYSALGKTFDYKKRLIQELHSITSEEIKECANKYFTDNYILAVLRP